MNNISDDLNRLKDRKRVKNISTEFQMFGIYLADSLGDQKHYALYIKLAKTYPRGLLEEALTYTKGYNNAANPGKVFMWRLSQLKKEAKIATTAKKIEDLELIPITDTLKTSVKIDKEAQ